MKFLFIFLALSFSFNSYGGTPKKEDALANQYWTSLDTDAKTVFLVGFRHSAGPVFHINQREPLRLDQEDISKLIPLIDSFYKSSENKDVYLRFAVEVCLMQIMGKPKAEINEVTKTARYVTKVHD